MSRRPRSVKGRPRRFENIRQIAVLVSFAAPVALGLIASGKYIIARQLAAATALEPSDDEIYTGSILYVPDEGTICHQVLFDNRNGRMSDNGDVDCERAANSKNWSSSERLETIRFGFRAR
jgi:hypothetical protein